MLVVRREGTGCARTLKMRSSATASVLMSFCATELVSTCVRGRDGLRRSCNGVFMCTGLHHLHFMDVVRDFANVGLLLVHLCVGENNGDQDCTREKG